MKYHNLKILIFKCDLTIFTIKFDNASIQSSIKFKLRKISSAERKYITPCVCKTMTTNTLFIVNKMITEWGILNVEHLYISINSGKFTYNGEINNSSPM